MSSLNIKIGAGGATGNRAVIEDAVGKAIEWMLAQGGGWVIAFFIGTYSYFLDKRMQEERREAEEQALAANIQIREQYEKRLEEFREILDVMTNSTTTVTSMHTSLTASSDAINQLALGFTKLLAEFQAQQARWEDRKGTMAKQLDDIQSRIEHLQRTGRGRVA